MARLLKKLHVSNGDIIALKYQSTVASEDVAESITIALGKMGLEQCIVIVVENFDDLTVLNETEMNKHGWYHLSKIKKVIKIPEKEK